MVATLLPLQLGTNRLLQSGDASTDPFCLLKQEWADGRHAKNVGRLNQAAHKSRKRESFFNSFSCKTQSKPEIGAQPVNNMYKK